VELQWLSFETTEACPGKQPMVLDAGEVLLWDGRLDNGREILNALGISRPPPSSDVEIVAAAWSEWGEKCLAKLVGDWALSLWIPSSRHLLLAADTLATRHLFYAVEKDCVQWSSVAHPLILMSERSLTLDEEYLAGWVGSFPAPHLTPFRELHRVPPASVVTIRPGSVSIRRYWDFGGALRIRYASDREYEEHFLQVFRQSVRRRLRSNSPILAELSGGMDSSAIVCVADQLTAESHRTKIDTVSYYDDSEPHWNERPWFTRIESHRGQGGLHIDVNAVAPEPKAEGVGFRFQPGAGAVENPMLEFMINRGHRALLSGIGGDEFLGGVPTPLPELENLLASGKLGSLARQLTVWALIQRRPWIDLLRNTAAAFLTSAIRNRSGWRQPPPWLTPGFARRQQLPLSGYSGRLKLSGPLPSFQENLEALAAIRRQLACADPSSGYPIEKRYPYLDRDLLEYLFAVPREQLVRPGERRSLMRRSLAGIVPGEVLNRRRKAFVSRAPLRMIRRQFDALSSDGNRLRLAELGIVDPGAFRGAIGAVLQEREAAVLPLMRALTLEQWLRALDRGGVLDSRQSEARQPVKRDETRREPVSDPSAL
jgi:asparagine synthase (glutamine-hydrolysing)